MKERFLKMFVFWLIGLWAAPTFGRSAGEEAMAEYLMSEKGESCIEVQAGKPFALRFYSTPGTGYSWEFAVEPDKQLLEFVGEKVEDSKSGRLGGRVFVVWVFKALAIGETEISMKYVRPWEKDVEPIKSYVFKVKIQ
jgi:inhibitor of cysteine peptidase